MRNYAMIEGNNIKRTYKLINVSQGINLIPFLNNKTINYSRFTKTIDGNIAPDTLSFTLRFPYLQKIVEAEAEKYMYIDSELLKGLATDDVVGSLEAFSYKGTINILDLIKENHEFYFYEEFNGTEIFAFTGVIDFDSFTYERDKRYFYMNITAKDKTSMLLQKKYAKDYLFKDVYLANNADKANSLYHQFGYILGLQDSEMDIDDVKSGTDFIKIPLVYLKKDEQIVKDLAEAVRLVNTVYTFNNNKLTIKVNRTTETYVFNKSNTLSKISIKPIRAEFDKLKVTYDRYFSKEKQMMWALVGDGGTPESANILVRANTPRKFKVDWFYEVDFISDYETYEIVFANVNGTAITPNYTLDITGTGGILEIIPGAQDVYVKSFKIKGVPMWCQGGNTSYYPGESGSDRVKSIENKFIQNETLAGLHQKIYFDTYCRTKKEFNFTTNVAHFLVPGIKIYLDHEDYQGYIIIDSITFNTDKMSIKAIEYLEPFPIGSFQFMDKSMVDEAEVKSKSVLQNLGLYEKDKPPVPDGLVLESMPLGFVITFNRPTNVSLKGHWIYIKKQTDSEFMKFFANSNYFFYQTVQLSVYEVKVANISINGAEGDTTEIKIVLPLLVENNVIDYPVGLSPSELDTKVQTINGHITDINDEVDLHGVNIELIEADIVNMKKTDSDNYTAITQNAQSIQNVAQEVTTKTTANQVQTITNTAIESFSANEFRRTLGTRVSVIDYSKNIDEVTGLEIDSDELVEVQIEDYYSSIYQNSREILSLIKTSDEQYSSIMQLVDNITLLVQSDSDAKSLIQQLSDKINLLVQKDDENYSLIEQLTNALTFAVKKDGIVSSINQTAEEIQINAGRIALGSGLVVENDRVVVRELGAEHIRGNKLEGVEIISENATLTERVYINSGKVAHQKRVTAADEYRDYEKLSMQESGEVRCNKSWCGPIDLKTYNGNLPWSNLKIITFIGNQYQIASNQFATSREIRQQWYGNIEDQKIQFKVSGGMDTDTSNQIELFEWGNNTPYFGGTTDNRLVVFDKVMSISATITLSRISEYIRGITQYGSTKVFLKADNEAEMLIAQYDKETLYGSPQVLNRTLTYQVNYTTPKRVTIRREIKAYDGSEQLPSWSKVGATGCVTLTGNVTTRSTVLDTDFDATVKWIAIGNS